MKILVTADWHVRGEAPRCRTDEDWISSQREDIQHVWDIARDRDVNEIWILGDLFHQPRCSTEAVNMLLGALKTAPAPVYILPGNHDLPFHAYAHLESSSLGIVLKTYPELTDRIFPDGLGQIRAWPFGLEPEYLQNALAGARIWATHQLTFEAEKDRPIEGVGKTAQELLDEAPPSVNLVLTGDYHHGYCYEEPGTGRKVLTPGCLNIQAADMKDYQPKVWVLELTPDSSNVIPIDLPAHRECIADGYLEAEKEREARMEKCLASAAATDAVSLDFSANLEKAAAALPEGPRGIIQEIQDHLNKDRT